jgi:hypothetical protein
MISAQTAQTFLVRGAYDKKLLKPDHKRHGNSHPSAGMPGIALPLEGKYDHACE